jgi:hypothetical protein
MASSTDIHRGMPRQVGQLFRAAPLFVVSPLLQPWHVRWGATDAEVTAAMPGTISYRGASTARPGPSPSWRGRGTCGRGWSSPCCAPCCSASRLGPSGSPHKRLGSDVTDHPVGDLRPWRPGAPKACSQVEVRTMEPTIGGTTEPGHVDLYWLRRAHHHDHQRHHMNRHDGRRHDGRRLGHLPRSRSSICGAGAVTQAQGLHRADAVRVSRWGFPFWKRSRKPGWWLARPLARVVPHTACRLTPQGRSARSPGPTRSSAPRPVRRLAGRCGRSRA